MMRVRFHICALAGLALIAGCRAHDQQAHSGSVGPTPKLVVQPWRSELVGPADEKATVGLAGEVTRWLRYSPDLVVREPRTELAKASDRRAAVAALLDVDHVLWLELRLENGEATVVWDLEHAPTGSILAGGELTRGWDALPEVPRGIARVVLQELGVERRAAIGSFESRSVAADATAYSEYVRLMGADIEGGNEEAWLVRRVTTLEDLLPGLGNYPPAATVLGSDYLELAGLVGGRGPHYQRAQEALARAFDLDPGYPPARAKLASLLTKLGRPEEAVELLTAGLTTHPDYPAFHETLGYALRYAGLMKASIESYQRGQELDASLDNLVSTQDQITKSLIYLGDYEAALASHQRMMSFLEQLDRPANEKQRFYEGVIHLYRGDRASAVTAFRAGARLEPGSVWTTFGRAYEGMALGDTARVESVLDDLERRDVVDGERHYRLVHFATFAGHTERALEHLREAVDGGFFNTFYIQSDPLAARLRSVPEFDQIMRTAAARHDAVRTRIASGSDRAEPMR